jgi:hypothetical protein
LNSSIDRKIELRDLSDLNLQSENHMLQPCQNPECSVQYAVGLSECPACRTPAPQGLTESEPPKRILTGAQIVKSVLLTGLGATPGAIWFANVGSTQSAVILALGALIGFGLSLPGVSVGNVLAGTAGMIIMKNAPRSMHDEISNTFFRNADDVPKDDSQRR